MVVTLPVKTVVVVVTVIQSHHIVELIKRRELIPDQDQGHAHEIGQILVIDKAAKNTLDHHHLQLHLLQDLPKISKYI